MATDELWVTYWLRASSHTKPDEQGYVGVCLRRRISHRVYKHHWANETHKRFTPDFEWEILFEGSETECFKLERNLRPEIKIGWNLAAGGEEGRGSGSKGVPKSPKQKAKMRAAALARYADPTEHERTAKAVKKGLRNIDRSGA